jgi:RNA polymerase sigma-70 factor (ECF subfamily)
MPFAVLPLDLSAPIEESLEEKVSILYRCIGELEETERIIISLELEGLPQAEIASVVGLSNGNVRVKVHRIKDKLAIKLKAYEQFR